PPHHVVLIDWRGSVASEAAALSRLDKALHLPGTHTVCTGSNDAELVAAVRAVSSEPLHRR
ncbi:MAG TPA: hypothetical protein VLK29_05900, partial [Luteimonas sp.]|nr:hypothetical protein [Luteimonas sp.]